MNYFKELKLLLRVIVNPLCWFRNYEYNKDVDNIVRELVENSDQYKVSVEYYRIIIDNIPIWTSNFPYASGSIEKGVKIGSMPSYRTVPLLPSRRTTFLLNDLIIRIKHQNSLNDIQSIVERKTK